MNINKEGFIVRCLNQQDVEIFQNLIRLFREEFEEEGEHKIAKPAYLARLLSRPDFICYVVQKENELVGGLTAYELQKYYTEESEIFIYDIAIKLAFRRKGLEKELLLALQEYGRGKGIQVIFVAAHAADGHAVEFYKSTGGEGEDVVHFNYVLSNSHH